MYRMIRRIQKNQDLVINLKLDLEGANTVTIEYYTDKEYIFTVTVDPSITEQVVYLPAEELEKMNEGQLRCTIKYSYDNTNFPDNTQDIINEQDFELWLQ